MDRDTHPHFDKAMKLCEVEGVRVARSNPCFELWLILHYEHYDRPGTNKDVQRHQQPLVERHMSGLQRGEADCLRWQLDGFCLASAASSLARSLSRARHTSACVACSASAG